MMKMKRFATVLIVSLLALVALGQTRESPEQSLPQDLLQRPVLSDSSEYYEATDAFYASLGLARVPGGMIRIVKCGEEVPKQVWKPMGLALSEVLDAIVAADSRYKWVVQDGTINLVPVAGSPALLGTRINKFRIRKATSAWDALNQLIRLPEVQKARDDLGLKPGVAFILSSNPPQPKKFSLHLRGVSLRQALNAIARAQGREVWEYIEIHCGDRHEVVIRF